MRHARAGRPIGHARLSQLEVADVLPGIERRASAVLRRAKSIERLRYANGAVGDLVAVGAETEGRFGLFRWEMPAMAKGGAAPHFHRTFSESFYVLSGTFTVYGGDAWIPARPGDFLYVPEGGIHGFRNESDAPAAMLILFSPGAPREAFFRELAEIGSSGRSLSTEEWDDLYARHDQVMV